LPAQAVAEVAPTATGRTAPPPAAPPAPARAALGAWLSLRDTASARAGTVLPPSDAPGGSLEAALRWLRRTHAATGFRGSSKGFHLLHGWLPAYPETTGYVIGTMLAFAGREGDDGLVGEAVRMGDWEIEVQRPDGGIGEGHVEVGADRSIVFNTGMVMHGWVDLLRAGHGERFLDAAVRAGRFLVEAARPDGTWDPAVEYSGIPHTYNSRVSWAMLRLAEITDDAELREAAVRQLDWVVGRQRPNAWFDSCVFKPDGVPSTHGIAYTLRGLLESSALLDEPRYLDSALEASEVLIRKLEVLGRLPADWDADWRPASSHECVTGNAQLGGVWLRLFRLTSDPRFANAGLKAVDIAARQQYRGPVRAIDGAVPGSFPIYGRYAPMQFPNWAAKFLADSLMLRDDVLRELA
jgi:hypothetical protein